MTKTTNLAATTAQTSLLGVTDARNALAKIHPDEHHLLLLAGPKDLVAAQAAGIPAVSVLKPTKSDLSRTDLEAVRQFGCDVIVLYPHTRRGYAWGLEAAVGLGDHKVPVRLIEWPGNTEAGFSLARLHAEAGSHLRRAVERLPCLLSSQLPMRPSEGFFHPKLPSKKPFCYPQGYALGRSGTYEEDSGDDGRYLKRVAARPLWLDELMEDMDSQEFALRVCTSEAQPMRVPRGVLMDSQRLKALADFNFPVRSVGAGAVCRYLEEAEAKNRGRMVARRTVSRMGWRADDAFIWGTTIISDSGDSDVQPTPAAGMNEKWFTRHQVSGDPNQWASILGDLSQYHVPTILLLASLVSPLLSKLGVQSAVYETAGETGSGKTSAQTIAQSAWGYGHESALPSWNSTAVGLEVLLATHNHLPLILNENQSHGHPEKQARVAYMIGEGTGRVRANKSLGLNEIKTWNLNVLASGEHSMTSSTQYSGIVARVFPLWSPAFGGRSNELARIVDRFKAVVNEHYGHAGPMMVRRLMAMDDHEWETLRRHHQEAQEVLVQKAQGTAQQKFSVRMAQSWGVLWVGASLLEKLFPGAARKGAYHEAILKGWEELMTRGEERCYSERALDVVRGFLASMKDRLETDHHSPVQPVGKIARTRDGVEFVGFIKEPLEEALEKAGLSLSTASEHWENAGYLLTRDGHHWPTKVNGSTVRCIAFRQTALRLEEAVEEVEPTPAPLPDDGPF